MNFKLIFSALSLLSMGYAYACPQIKGPIVDLTHPFDQKTIYWPTEKGFALEKVAYGMTPGGFFYSANKFCAPEHGGTHVDAPIHFNQNGLTVDQIPVEQLVGDAVVINVTEQAQKEPDYSVTLADIQSFEKKYRPLNEKDIVLFYTGWGQYWDNKKKYLGTDVLGDVKNLHFPGISKEAAEYLVQRKVKGLGLDTPSMDAGINNVDSWAHRVILGANLYGIENVAHLDQLPAVGATLVVAPMKITGGSGAPARVYAFLP